MGYFISIERCIRDRVYKGDKRGSGMILSKIADAAKIRIQKQKEAIPFENIKKVSLNMPLDTGFPFEKALDKKDIAFICEIKKASPSKGIKMCIRDSIDADTWTRVQELRKNKRRPTRTGKTNMFSGIVRCADCGEKLYYCTSKNFETRQDHFVCSTSRLKGKEVCRCV